MAHPLDLAWNPAAQKQDGLDTIRNTLIAIENDRPLDPLTARHVADAFRRYLDGHHDLTRNFGLRPGRGRSNETPVKRERMLKRDALICEALYWLGGNTPFNRIDLHDLLRAPVVRRRGWWGYMSPVYQLRYAHGGPLKLSEKQIYRIATGANAYSQRKG